MSSGLCPYCMQMSDSDLCPHCGRDVNYDGSPAHLPAGYVVSGKHPYVLGAALGQGGFGITYIALDMVTNERVAIKEYFPTYCSSRTNGTVSAYPNQEDVYKKGRERFLDEARTLKTLSDLPNIVNVLDFFELNNTAYLVMEFLEGRSLKEYAAENGTFPAQAFLKQIKPLMEDIQKMHDRGVIHRDIAPDNIILQPDGQMKLIDFGAARSYVGDKSMTVVVKKGFAPVEQYMSKGSTSATDVYALAATVYYCITGKVPPDSAERQYDKAPLPRPSSLGTDITPKQEKALLKALEVLQKERTQSVQMFLEQLQSKPAPQLEPIPPAPPAPFPRRKLLAILAAAAVLVLCVGFFLFPKQQVTNAKEQPTYPKEQPRTSATKKTVVSIAAGYSNTLVLFEDGSVVNFGTPEYDYSNWSDIVMIDSGISHTVGLKSDGTVICVGSNEYGQCNVSTWKDIVAICAGANYTVGLKADGTLIACGQEQYLINSGAVGVSNWTDITAISAGHFCTVGLKADGTVIIASCGSDFRTGISSWENIIAICDGAYHTVGLKSDGTVVACGRNTYNQRNVSSWSDITAIGAGHSHTIGLCADGTVVAAGDNQYGQCNVSNWSNIVAIYVGSNHTIGLKSDGSLVATGLNNYGQCDVTKLNGFVNTENPSTSQQNQGTEDKAYTPVEFWGEMS